MEEDAPARTRCHCGAPRCRSTLTGRDLTNTALQRKYRGHFSAHLAEEIRRSARRRGRRGARRPR